MCFDINKESEIFVYGGGTLGRSFYYQLKNDGYLVNGIIDRNADKITNKEGISFFTIKDFADIYKGSEIVIICVHNALWHAEIVDALKPLGIENVLFVPLGKEFGRRKSDEMMKAYNHFVNREYDSLNSIPTLSSLCDKKLNVQRSVIHETDESVVCWIDITTLYTSESVAYATQRHAPKELEQFADTPMPGMLPYVMLFRLLAGQSEGEGDSFVRLCKRFQNSIDEYSDEEFLNDRFDLYDELNTQLNFGIERFIDSAPDCRWNTKGFFNLLDGMSRTTFLYTKGFQYVPVKMKREEFDYWAYQEGLDTVTNVLPKTTNWEIEHPAFIEYPARYPGVKRKVLSSIEEYYNSQKWDGERVIDYTETDGCLARYFARQGALVTRCVGEKNKEFEVCLNKLLRQEKNISIISEPKEIQTTSIVLLSTDEQSIEHSYHIIENNKNAQFLCLYHNMGSDDIKGFEKKLDIESSWTKIIRGRETITICVYRKNK